MREPTPIYKIDAVEGFKANQVFIPVDRMDDGYEWARNNVTNEYAIEMDVYSIGEGDAPFKAYAFYFLSRRDATLFKMFFG